MKKFSRGFKASSKHPLYIGFTVVTLISLLLYNFLKVQFLFLMALSGILGMFGVIIYSIIKEFKS